MRARKPDVYRARCQRSIAQRGFTLIEVLAALVIVALGMLGAIQAVNQSIRNGTYLREKTLAHWIAMNLITERRLNGTPPEVAESTGELEYAGQRWRWQLKVTQTEVASLRRMDIAVRSADAPENSSLARLSGFYGAAVGAAGGGSLAWGGGNAPGGGGGDGDGDGDGSGTGGGDGAGNDDDDGMNRPDRPPRAPRPPPSPEGDVEE